MMQGSDFKSTFVGGLLGSLGAELWGAAMNGIGLGNVSELVITIERRHNRL